MKDRPVTSPANDAVATLGLLLNLASVITFTLSFVGFALGNIALAATGSVVTLLCFATSMACFASDGRRLDRDQSRKLVGRSGNIGPAPRL